MRISPHSALVQDHAFARGKLRIRTFRRTKPWSTYGLSSGKCPYRTMPTSRFRYSPWRIRLLALVGIARHSAGDSGTGLSQKHRGGSALGRRVAEARRPGARFHT